MNKKLNRLLKTCALGLDQNFNLAINSKQFKKIKRFYKRGSITVEQLEMVAYARLRSLQERLGEALNERIQEGESEETPTDTK